MGPGYWNRTRVTTFTNYLINYSFSSIFWAPLIGAWIKCYYIFKINNKIHWKHTKRSVEFRYWHHLNQDKPLALSCGCSSNNKTLNARLLCRDTSLSQELHYCSYVAVAEITKHLPPFFSRISVVFLFCICIFIQYPFIKSIES